MSYLLCNHVHVCRAGRHVLLLDLLADRYLGIPADESNALVGRVEGWPVIDMAPADATHEAKTDVIKRMHARGLITNDPARGRSARPVTIEAPSVSMPEGYENTGATIGAMDFVQFVRATCTAHFMMRRLGMHRTAERVRRRTSRHDGTPFESGLCLRRVGVFARLRTFFFSSYQACLFESLALSEFLAASGLYPNLVFGVLSRPFHAHCWLQKGGIVINDDADRVRDFTPIMVL
jgi:hypothetical protein